MYDNGFDSILKVICLAGHRDRVEVLETWVCEGVEPVS